MYFPWYLAKVLLESHCYEHLKHFTPIFNDLKNMARSSAVAPLIIALVAFDSSSDAAMDHRRHHASPIRAMFFTSTLYRELLCEHVQRLACPWRRQCQGLARRAEVLRQLAESDCGDESVKDAVIVARSIFAIDLPLVERVAYVLDDESRARMSARVGTGRRVGLVVVVPLCSCPSTTWVGTVSIKARVRWCSTSRWTVLAIRCAKAC